MDILKRIAGIESDPALFLAFLGHLPNPDEILKRAGVDQAVYSRVLGDPHVFSKVIDRRAGLQRREWEVSPADGSGPAKRAAELCARAITRLENHPERHLGDVLYWIQEAVFRGYRALEVVWESTTDGYLPVEVTDIPNRRLVHDGKGWRLLTQKNPTDGIVPPNHKILLATSMASSDNPYGEALLSRCFWPWTFKHNSLKWWAQLSEKHGLPWLIAEGAETQAKAQELVATLKTAILDAVVALPRGVTVRAETVPGGKGDLHHKLASFCNAEISKVLVGQTLSTEIQGEGSRAAAETHAGLRDEIVEADGKLVAHVMGRLFAWILAVNQVAAPVPEFKWIEKDRPDKAWAEVAEKAIQAMPGGVPKRWAWEKFGIPLEMEAEEMLPAGPEGAPPPVVDAAFAQAGQQFDPQQQALEDLGDQAMNQAALADRKRRTAITKAIEAAGGYDALSQILADLAEAGDPFGVAEPLYHAALAARFHGMKTVSDETGDG